MQNFPLVSIVTPAYNQAEYLDKTIESVLRQDYPNIEYIVIDDGSSDDSLAIARRYESQDIKVLTQTNSGQATTLNKGWGMAHGEFLAYLSSDDCLLPDAVSTMVSALQDMPQASVAYCDFWLIDVAGRRLRESRTEDFNERRLCVDLVCQPGPGALFRRTVFDRTGGWNGSLRQVPDFEFWLRAARLGPFVRVPRTLAEYRIHEGSASFRVMPPSRADEIVEVVQAYWPVGDARGEIALARAFALASKNHAQSGRLLKAIKLFGRALYICPALVLDLGVWRQLLVGLLRRSFYHKQFAGSRS